MSLHLKNSRIPTTFSQLSTNFERELTRWPQSYGTDKTIYTKCFILAQIYIIILFHQKHFVHVRAWFKDISVFVFILKYTRSRWRLRRLHPSHPNLFGKNQNHKTKQLGHVNLRVGAVRSKSPLLGVGDYRYFDR